jgi:hypothetical protein
LLLLAVVGGTYQRHSIACAVLPVFTFERLESEVYRIGDGANVDTALLLSTIAHARQRLSDRYGTPSSRPRFLITENIEEAKRWGAKSTASMHRAPWGSCIVVGPMGHNVDVIAHEWMHAEVQHRVGFRRLLREIPVWFDEGVALTLDRREPYRLERISNSQRTFPAVHELASARAFFDGDVVTHYQASRLAVEPLLDPEQFYADLERVRGGESFESVFMSRAGIE